MYQDHILLVPRVVSTYQCIYYLTDSNGHHLNFLVFAVKISFSLKNFQEISPRSYLPGSELTTR